jgi:endoglucanase
MRIFGLPRLVLVLVVACITAVVACTVALTHDRQNTGTWDSARPLGIAITGTSSAPHPSSSPAAAPTSHSTGAPTTHLVVAPSRSSAAATSTASVAVASTSVPAAPTKPVERPSAPAASPTSFDVNPLAMRPFYTWPNTYAAAAVAEGGQNSVLSAIADTPQADWFGDWDPTQSVAADVAAYVQAAHAAGAEPVLVTYAIPHLNCNTYGGVGVSTEAQYDAWLQQVVAGVGQDPAAVVVEPDALAMMDCLSSVDQASRIQMLNQEVMSWAARPNVAVYIDGGTSHWLPAATLVARLKEVGVEHARGFALNVSNFYTNADEDAYGEAVSELLGGTHYIVDSSRNGLGPAPDGPTSWCNPPGRALGVHPTTKTGAPHADAYLWVKDPGETDGNCGAGQPASGWFNAYALELVADTK